MAAEKDQFSALVPLPPARIRHQSAADLVLDDGRARFEAAAETVIAAKRSPGTRRAYRYELRCWLGFCDERGCCEPDRPTLGDATAYRDELLHKRAAASVHRACAALAGIYKHLLRRGAARANPFHSAVLAWPSSTPTRPTPAASDDHVRAMLAAAKTDTEAWRGARDFTIVALLWHTGLRRSSVASLRVQDLRRDGEHTVLRAIVKGGARRDVVLVPEAEDARARWLQCAALVEGPLFPKSQGSLEAISGDGVYRVLQRLARRGDCSAHVTPHQLRAAMATAGYDAGIPEYEVQGALHHARPETTRLYDRGRRGARALEAVAAARRR